MNIDTDNIEEDAGGRANIDEQPLQFYRIQFRPEEHIYLASSKIGNISKGEVAMVQTEHGLEPARVIGAATPIPQGDETPGRCVILPVARRGTREEAEKYDKLDEMEKEAFHLCLKHIERHKLPMKLAKVERFFNGGKIIFYFTAESRVDFRELVKGLVQEFRTRVEMRQIGVRHETKMIGGLGCCGRELCCASFIKKFESVSIKMAKEQNLPLNPAKISGACNRLLCCLTYEFNSYRACRKKMPKIGKRLKLGGKEYKVRRHNVLKEEVVVADQEGTERTIAKKEWQAAAAAPAAEQSQPETGGDKP